HFAHGPLATLAAYLGWWAAQRGLPLELALLTGISAGALIGVLCYQFLYRPFERSGSPALVILIGSLGLYIVTENFIGAVFGTDTKVLANAPSHVFLIGPVVITMVQAMQMLALLTSSIALALFLGKTRFGRAVLAMNDNIEMARVVGIDTHRIALLVFGLGSAIAACAALLILMRDGASSHMGFNLVFMGFVAVVVGGIGSLRGAVAGGYALGLVESLGMWKIPSEWQSSIAFVVLFLVLLLRPQGLFAGRQ
ncbi:MAG: branched-chain amino acid ABC transporter permease, partial [Burkholderiaceae bacterium]